MSKDHTTEGRHWVASQGGTMGPHYVLKKGDKYIGHFYVDCDETLDAEDELKHFAPIVSK